MNMSTVIVNSVSASACHIGGPKGVSPGQKALLHGKLYIFKKVSRTDLFKYKCVDFGDVDGKVSGRC